MAIFRKSFPAIRKSKDLSKQDILGIYELQFSWEIECSVVDS